MKCLQFCSVPSSPLRSSDTRSDLILIWSGEDDRSRSKLITFRLRGSRGSATWYYSLLHKDLYFPTDQVTDYYYSPCNVQNKYWAGLAKFMGIHELDHSQARRTVFLGTDATTSETSRSSIFEEVGGRKVVKKGHNLIILDGNCCYRAVELLNRECHFPRTYYTFFMCQIMLCYWRRAEQAETIMRRRNSSSTTDIVHIERYFLDIMKALISFVRTSTCNMGKIFGPAYQIHYQCYAVV